MDCPSVTHAVDQFTVKSLEHGLGCFINDVARVKCYIFANHLQSKCLPNKPVAIYSKLLCALGWSESKFRLALALFADAQQEKLNGWSEYVSWLYFYHVDVDECHAICLFDWIDLDFSLYDTESHLCLSTVWCNYILGIFSLVLPAILVNTDNRLDIFQHKWIMYFTFSLSSLYISI